MKDIVNDLKKSDIWNIQLTVTINFVSSNDTDKEIEMLPKSDNIDILIYDESRWSYGRTFLMIF